MSHTDSFLLNEIKNVIAEATKIKFKGQQFVLKVDVNEDPNKKGIKIQFIPTSFGNLTKIEQDDIAISLEEKLEAGLNKLGIRVERDRQLKDKTVIGFFIYIEYLHKIIRQALTSTSSQDTTPPESEKSL